MAVPTITPAADPGIALASTLSSATPLLASGTIVPPQATTSGAASFTRAGDNVNLNQSEVVNAMEDMVQSNVAGHTATVGVLRQILEAILGIEIDGETLSRAIDNYRRKEAVSRG